MLEPLRAQFKKAAEMDFKQLTHRELMALARYRGFKGQGFSKRETLEEFLTLAFSTVAGKGKPSGTHC